MTDTIHPASEHRLVLAGKGHIACKVAEHVLTALQAWGLDWRVLGVPTRADTGQDSWEPSFAASCRRLGIPTVPTVADAQLRTGDLLLSLQFDRIIRMPELGGSAAYNLHFSALPRHRGCYPAMWALRDGDTHAGVSLHVLTAGIDDGPVVDTTLIPLDDHTTARDLYDCMHVQGAALVQRHLPALLQHRAAAKEQDASLSCYHDRHSIDFRQLELPHETLDVASCSRLARSLMFPPFQYPTTGGRAIVACDGVPDLPGHPADPSQSKVRTVGSNRLLLRCLDGWLAVRLADSDGDAGVGSS